MDTITERFKRRATEARSWTKKLKEELSSLEEAVGREASWEQVAKVDHLCRQLEILTNHLKSKKVKS